MFCRCLSHVWRKRGKGEHHRYLAVALQMKVAGGESRQFGSNAPRAMHFQARLSGPGFFPRIGAQQLLDLTGDPLEKKPPYPARRRVWEFKHPVPIYAVSPEGTPCLSSVDLQSGP